VGHLRCILETAINARERDALCVVIVNGDGFLDRKKGRPFMRERERAEIIAGIKGVDHVVLWDDGTQFVSGCIDILQPIVFTKGGDRTDATNVPEFSICERIGCEVMFNVGGGKIQSSSDLIAGSRQK
jgi:D-beta-D-heptose 7-phosphate kinase/D-beta-D-heptose 1-phosphate adenosyltransferase